MTISNSPPPFEAFSLHIEELFSLVSSTVAGAVVTTDEQDAALDNLMDDLRKARKDADAERDAEKRPLDEQAKEIQAKWKPLLARCDAGVVAIKALLTPYRDAKQKAKDEAARIAREEAAAKQKDAQDALQASDDLEARFAAEEQLKQAAKLTAVANKIDRSATGLRTSYRAEITNYTAFARWAWLNRQEAMKEALDAIARAEATGPRDIDGLTVHIERQAA